MKKTSRPAQRHPADKPSQAPASQAPGPRGSSQGGLEAAERPMEPLSSDFFATVPKGVEQILADELQELGIDGVEPGRGAVGFKGDVEAAYRVCLWSRTATRVLKPLVRFEARSADQLYDGVRKVRWTEHLGPDRTLAVEAAGRNAPAGPPHFVILKTKDAVVDQIRERRGERPNVDTERPDVRIHVHLAGPQVTVSLDLAGRGLHRRGIQRAGAQAPLKENLAAAVLRLSGWHERAEELPLYDPFCGSGTLLVEAAWMALDVAPGLLRESMGAEGWLQHDPRLWRSLLLEAEERAESGRRNLGGALRIAGSDAASSSLQAARRNLQRARVDEFVRLERLELRDVDPPWAEPGLMVTNPPYGARLGDPAELLPLYELLGDVLKQRFPSWTAWVLCGEPSLAKRIGLRPSKRIPLFNGPIECRLLEIPISDRPATPGSKPGWRKPSTDAEAFARKLQKNRRKLGKWIKREGLTCYRLYDCDMRQFNLSVDWYDGGVRVEEYYRPKKVSAVDAEQRLRDAMQVIPEALGVSPEDVVLRVRKKQAPGRQHERRDDRRQERVVTEGDLKFWVNLEDYLDTGLFLDDRLLRRRIRDRSSGQAFLNLFAYSCAASVAAAAGRARAITSVDLSNTYLAWGRRNFKLNGFDPGRYDFHRADVLQWLERGGDRKRYPLIFVAPPSYSRSKGMRREFDIQRDHVWMLKRIRDLTAPGGEILFTTNLRDFKLDRSALGPWRVENITEAITPLDFANRPRLKAWSLSPR